MTVFKNTADGGTAGTVVTTGNSGGASGSAFTVVAGTAVTFTATARHGTLGYRAVFTNGAAGYVALGGGTPNGQFSCSVYVYFEQLPATTHQFLALANAAGNNVPVALNVTSAGTIEATSSSGFIGSCGGTVTVGRWYRVRVTGSTGASGGVQVAVFDGDSASQPVGGSWTKDMGAVAPALLAVGKVANIDGAAPFMFDTISWQPDSSAPIGPEVVVAAVTANAGPDLVAEPGQTCSVVARGENTATGTYVKTGVWTQVAGTPVALTSTTTADGVATARFTAPKTASTQTITLRLTLTDSNGMTSTDDVTVTVPPWCRWRRVNGVLVAI